MTGVSKQASERTSEWPSTRRFYSLVIPLTMQRLVGNRAREHAIRVVVVVVVAAGVRTSVGGG